MNQQQPTRNSSYLDLALMLLMGIGIAILLHWVLQQTGLKGKEVASFDWKPVLGSSPMVAGAAKWGFDKLKVVWSVAESNRQSIEDLKKKVAQQDEKLEELTRRVLILEVQYSNLYTKLEE